MNLFEAIFLGLIQGLTEFIPVSSTGHLILAREFFNIHGGDLAFDAVLQLATSLAVLVYFIKIVPEIIRRRPLLWALVAGTIPAVISGLLLESQIETVFRNPALVAWMLIAGSVLMYLADKHPKEREELGPKNGLLIGFFQSLALLPGISRSGATISGGVLSGIERNEAVRFSFLLSFPIIFGSGAKKLFDLYTTGAISSVGWPLLVGSITAFVTGLLAIRFLIGYLQGHKFTVFIWYRVILAVLILSLI